MFSSNQSNVAVIPAYIEDVFSTYLYTGNGSTQTITNGIDLSTKGGLTWIKARTDTSGGATSHALVDTVRGSSKWLSSNATSAEATNANLVTGFTTSGFSVGNTAYFANENAIPYASWTFREQAKFFDVVTWTGSGANRTISHSLGSVPACIMVKRTDTTADWAVYHRSLANTEYLVLNSDAAKATGATRWNSTTPTSSVFSLGTDATVNASGGTYVAYIFAHNAGGFGLAGTDNVISCGSYTGTGAANNQINIGYEPQWVLVKNVSSVTDWIMGDVMRGMPIGSNFARLQANLSAAEDSVAVAGWLSVYSQGIHINGTGGSVNGTGDTYIYIALRRGPMKVPTLGTSVFTPATRTGDGATSVNVTNATFPIDLAIGRGRSTSAATPVWIDRLRGATRQFRSDNTDAEAASTIMSSLASQTGWIGPTGGSGSWNTSSVNYIQWYMRRAPSFFDEVCYTGTGSAQNVTHNLTLAPELMIFKSRSNGGAGYSWVVGSSALPSWGRYLQLNEVDAVNGSNNAGPFNNTAPTSSVFTVNTWSETNGSGATYVAYLFATCAGVSKVFSYTGNGSSQTINCGFTAGSRWVMIKRTDSTGDWYVWDSARGIVAGNDPHLSLNTTAAEVTSDDSVDTDNTGFVVNQLSATNVNVTSATYIGIAIA